MGQYYKAYVRNDEGEKVFCPQNAIYMTKNGIEDSAKIVNPSWDVMDPNSFHSNFSGLKLTEHSWLENDFVNGVLEAIWDKPCRVAWVGDYADDTDDFYGYYTEDVYKSLWSDEYEPELPFEKVPSIHETGFIVNHDRGQYLDLARYAKVLAFSPTWGEGSTWVIHPLPLLTAIGNGRGGGDYSGVNESMVGMWAMDLLSFTEERPKCTDEVLIPFIED